MPDNPAFPALRYRRHPHLYEINTWVWLDELSTRQTAGRAGRRLTLGTVPDAEWDRLAELGFDFVWLMGVWQRSPAGRQMSRTDASFFPHYDAALPGWKMEHVVGSPYAVQAYRPDPRIGTWDELDAVRQKLRARGVGLILDFVTNHTGPDHEWIEPHPEFFVQGTLEDFRRNPAAFLLVERKNGETLFVARGRDPFFAPWLDTAQLNYSREDTRRAVIEELRNIARHCDGVRCDMAMLVLNEVFESTWRLLLPNEPGPQRQFWTEAVAALPEFVWIAEVYWDLEWRMQQLGFPFTYDKRLYDRLHSAPHEVHNHLRADLAYQNRSVRFLENHDEPRSAAVFSKERLPAVVALAGTLPGMRFYHQGQFEGRKIRPPMQLSAAAPEAPDAEVRALYERVLRISDERVFHDGEWRLLEVTPAGDATHESLVAYEWRLEREWRIVVVNLSDHAAQGKLLLPDATRRAAKLDFFDLLNDAHYERESASLEGDGLFVRLDGWRAHVFAINEKA